MKSILEEIAVTVFRSRFVRFEVVSRLMWKMLGRTFRCGSDVAA
jgi:hypothetical protein